MNIEKYIELLRFYLTEKIDEVNQSVQKGLSDEISNVISSIISSILAIFISTQFIEENGLGWAVLKVAILIVVYFSAYFSMKWLIKKHKAQLELKKANNKEISSVQVKKLISDFDHIACDSILLSWDFLKKINSKRMGDSEKKFCLIESIYYYKKAICVISLIMTYKDRCINSINVSNAITPYRIKNASESLNDISQKIVQAYSSLGIDEGDGIVQDYQSTISDLRDITKFIDDLV